MGSSGAGKTTLLRTLAAQAPPKHGQVLFDNLDIYRQFEQVRPLIGYVPQDDVLHPQLTVRRALYFSARLRLPADYSPAEITRRVDEIMDRLGIAGQADVAIGSTEKRGISGGQRKRVSLGMELLPDPAVLFLDEPTSGLSSTDAERVIVTLRQLARDGRTVLVTIHQPSQHVYEMFDQVAVVDNDTVRTAPAPPPQPGRLIFLGPVAQCPEYFRKHDRSGRGARSVGAEAIFNVIDGNPQTKTKDWEQAFRASPQYRQFVEEPLARPRPQVAGHRKRVNLPSLWHQFSTLVQRLWWIKSAERSSMWQMLLIQPLFVGGGIWLVSGALATKHTYVGPEYIPDFLRVGKTLFFAVFTAIWLGCNNTAREIVGEFPVYRRERMVGLSLTAYLGSKVVFFAGVALIQSLILAACLFIGIKLEANPLAFVFLLWTSNLSAVALGLLLSSLATRGELAVQLVPLALLPMILFGGGVTRLSEMNSDAVRSITNVIPARWAFEGALLLENANREVTLQAVPMAAPAVPGRYTIVHHYFEGTARDGRRIWVCVAVLYFFAAVLLAACAISLRVQDTH
jgi:ABC-type multidrug transport system ATPase subunit/ABC-type multidrug transport system permease subunit